MFITRLVDAEELGYSQFLFDIFFGQLHEKDFILNFFFEYMYPEVLLLGAMDHTL